MKNIIAILFMALSIQAIAQKKDSGFKIRELGPEEMIICPRGEHSSNLYLPPESDRMLSNKRSTGVFRDSLYPSVTEEFIPAIDFVLDFLERYFTSDVPINVHIEVEQLGGSALAGARPAFVVENFDYAPYKDTEYPIALAEKLLGKEINRSNQADIVVTINSEFESWFFEPNNPTKIRPNQIDLASVLVHEVIHGLGFTGNSFVDPDSGNGSLRSLLGNGHVNAYARNIINGAGEVLYQDYENGSAAMTEQFTSNDLRYNSETYQQTDTKPQLFAPTQYAQGSSVSHLGEVYNGGRDALMTFAFGGGEVIYFPGDFTLDMMFDMGWDGTRIIHEPALSTEDLNAAYEILADVESDSGFEPNSFMLHYSTDNFATVDNVIALQFDDASQQYKATLPAPGSELEYQYYFELEDGRGIKRTRPGGGPEHFFTFNYGVDTGSPIITFDEDNEVILYATIDDFRLRVNASDRFSGVKEVSSIININGVLDTILLSSSDVNDGNSYSGTFEFSRNFIPTDLVEYRFMAIDNSSNANASIFPEDGFLQARYIKDENPPIIEHDTVESVTNFDRSFKVRVSVLDTLRVTLGGDEFLFGDFLGVDDVFGIASVNDSEPDTFRLDFTPNLFGDFFEGTYTFEREFAPDDVISYSIFAFDRAFEPNKGIFPEDGSMITIPIVEIPEPLDFYFNDFANADDDFISSDFSVELISGFDNETLQNTSRRYREGITTTLNFTNDLKVPIIVSEDDAFIEFDEIVLVEPGEPGVRWPIEEFWDYVIVEARDLRGEEYIPLIDGYDSNSDQAWRSRWDSQIDGEFNSTALPTPDLFRFREIDIKGTGDFESGDTILIRFRLFSDPEVSGWGWMIDNLKIQNESTSVDDFISNTSVSLFPNPVKDGMLNVALELDETYDQSFVSIYDVYGKLIRRQRTGTISGSFPVQVNVQDLNPGIYLCEIQLGEGNVTRKFVIGN